MPVVPPDAEARRILGKNLLDHARPTRLSGPLRLDDDLVFHVRVDIRPPAIRSRQLKASAGRPAFITSSAPGSVPRAVASNLGILDWRPGPPRPGCREPGERTPTRNVGGRGCHRRRVASADPARGRCRRRACSRRDPGDRPGNNRYDISRRGRGAARSRSRLSRNPPVLPEGRMGGARRPTRSGKACS